MLHRLERKYLLPELLPLQGVGDCRVETPLCDANHLGADAHTAIVQQACRIPVTTAKFP